MVEVEEFISLVSKQGLKVLGTLATSPAVYEKTINFVESRIQLKNFVEEIS